jgi:hypothetical protein
MFRGVILWILWEEINRLTFQGGRCKSVRVLGGNIINFKKYWSQIKRNSCTNNIHLIVPHNVNSLPILILEKKLRLGQSEVKTKNLFGEEIGQLKMEIEPYEVLN